MTEVTVNTTYYFDIFVTDNEGEPVTGLNIDYSLYRSENNLLIITGPLIEKGNGVYQASKLFDILGQYRIIYNTPLGYEDAQETILVVDEGSSSQQTALIRRILGLTQENYRILEPIYDEANNMTSCTLKTYPSSLDCENDTNPIAVYNVVSTYTVDNNMSSYKVKKVV